MTRKAYVAIRCSEALPLTIVQRLKNQHFFKGPDRNLRKKTKRLAKNSILFAVFLPIKLVSHTAACNSPPSLKFDAKNRF